MNDYQFTRKIYGQGSPSGNGAPLSKPIPSLSQSNVLSNVSNFLTLIKSEQCEGV